VNIWNGPWIPHGNTRRPVTIRDGSLITSVSELIDPRTGLWDEALVQDTFWEFDAKAILKLRAYQELDDRSAWHFDKKGMFSVKSAYKLTVQQRENE
jgi:hypothetical protein